MINPQIEYISDDSNYMTSNVKCNNKKNSCNDCSRKRTESSSSECNTCSSHKLSSCSANSCNTKRQKCSSSDHFVVLNYFSELTHDWEKQMAKYNLGIQELENINYISEITEDGEYLTKVLFVFRVGHELITKEFYVAPKGEKGDKGDSLTWESLTPEIRASLKGAKGDDGVPPTFRYVNVLFTESSDEVGGRFNLVTNNVYDFILTLPKQRTFDECLTEIRNIISTFNSNFEQQLALINQKLQGIEDFDFCDLGLLLLNGNELAITYRGVTSNRVILNLPQPSTYTFKYLADINDKWNDLLYLLKDGLKSGDTFSMEKFKPKDWWILAYPNVILVDNDLLITKWLRISAWLGKHDRTEELSEDVNKDYEIYIQTTTSYEYNPITLMYDDSTWASLNDVYDVDSGILTLPENYSILANLAESGKTFKYEYHTGDFLTVVLHCNDTIPRRLYIPVINTSDIEFKNNYRNYFVDLDPRYISDDVSEALINYTKTWEFNLSGFNFYNDNGELINSKIKVYPGVCVYRYVNGKKYLYGNYEIVEEGGGGGGQVDPEPDPTTQLNISNFELQSIVCSNTTSRLIGLYFKYNDSGTYKDLTENLHAAFYQYWTAHAGSNGFFDKVLRLRNKDTNAYVDLTLLNYSTSGDTGVIYYRYTLPTSSGSSVGGRRPGQSNTSALASYTLRIKDSLSNPSYNTFFNIVVSTLGVVTLTLPSGQTDYRVTFNNNVMGQIADTIEVSSPVPTSVNAPRGLAYSNGMFFYNGLFIATSELDGEPTISDSEDYAYVIGDNSIQILNLTNLLIEVSIDGITYTLAPNANINLVLTPSEPAGH